MSTTSLQKWTEPKLSTSEKKLFLWFRFYDEITHSWKPVKRKGGANYSTLSKQERLEQLQILKKAITYKLEKLGWRILSLISLLVKKIYSLSLARHFIQGLS